MSTLQKIALPTLILTYSLLVLAFIFGNTNMNSDYLLFAAWIIGVTNAISNILLAEKIDINKWLIILFIISGILWIFPPLFFTYIGIPCLFIFLVIGIYTHIKAIKLIEKKNSVEQRFIANKRQR